MVVAAFGASGDPIPLEGGRGTSWRFGSVVLKPADVSLGELTWQAGLLPTIPQDGFRLSRPLRSRDGSLVVEAWCAWEYDEGRHQPRRWREIMVAGEKFHRVLRDVPRPSHLDARTDPWAIGDRVAWGDLPVEGFLRVKHFPV